MKPNPLLERIRSTLAETRLDLGLSQRELARYARVSASTVRRAENGGRVNDALVIHMAGVMTTLDLHRPARFEDEVEALVSRAAEGELR
jgi:transcriptional regulator with XRE-family HTH domain